ncbi:MAG: nitroreductase family protein [Prevotella sp.]
MKTINSRKSIRKYQSKEVDKELLNRLLEDSERTQTMGNLQLYSVIVSRNDEQKRKLAPAHFNQPMVVQAPVVLTFCADFHRTSVWAENRKATPGYDNFLSFLNAASDCLLYCQTFCNLAEEEGLGICYLGTTIYSSKAIIDILHLPRLVMPIATLTLGWPDENPPQTDRLPLSAIVHQETYPVITSNNIDEWYTEKEKLPESIRFCEINNKETLAQIFTDIRYTAKDNIAISSDLLDTLKQQGFL